MSKKSGILKEGWRGEGRRKRVTEKQKCRGRRRSRVGHRWRRGRERERSIDPTQREEDNVIQRQRGG